MIKGEKGITMIQMVITIVMMAIIAGFSIYNSRDTIAETKITKAYNEILIIKDAIVEVKVLDDSVMDVFSGDRLVNLDAYDGIADRDEPNQEYYFLDFKNKKELLEDIFNLRNIENNYIVNVKNLENIEVFLVDGVNVDDTLYYTADEIIEKYNDIFAGR